jgi:dUTP pyrophosphatase
MSSVKVTVSEILFYTILVMPQNQNKERSQVSRPARNTPVINAEARSTRDQLTKSSPNSAGYDVSYTGPDVVLKKGVVNVLPTGLFIDPPPSIFASIRPRSGLSSKGVIIPNSPGTIDSDYRGEIKVLLLNLMDEPYTVKDGDRITQMTFERSVKVEVRFGGQVSPSSTRRGGRGFWKFRKIEQILNMTTTSQMIRLRSDLF